MFQSYFGDDEHTAADGPYIRVMRTRKWLLITAAFSTLYNMQLLRPEEVGKLLKVVAVPSEALEWFLLGSLIYLLAVYVALVFQLAVVYDIVIEERLRFRKDKELESIQAKVDESRMEVIRLDEAKRTQLRGGITTGGVGQTSYSQAAHDAATSVYNRYVEQLSRIAKSDPADRPHFKTIEKCIDAVRVSMPTVVTLVAIAFLVRGM